jgi:multicomponent K+:H+ antiporter subunit D
MTPLGNALLIAPLAIPLAAGALALAVRDRAVAGALGVVATLAQLAVALALVATTAAGSIEVQLLGNWAAPFGIVLVADRLSALMLALTAGVGLASMLASRAAAAEGPWFHAFFQLQLLGLNGAFLTGDLFNLFVCFEVLLAASYALLLHGRAPGSVRSGLHYVAVNLVASALFLVAAALLYGVAGSLNLADLALRVPELAGTRAQLAAAAGLLLCVVFGVKAALVPVGFWLPAAYAAPLLPVAALFALLTKVGVYALLRVRTLVFPDLAGDALVVVGLVTTVVGAVAAVGAPDLRRQAAWLIASSAGTLVATAGLGTPAALAAALYYLPHSTLAAAALLLVAELLVRRRGASGDLLAPGPAMHGAALVGTLFAAAAVALVGLPPLAGFVAKVFLLQAASGSPWSVAYWSAVLGSSLVTLYALARTGSRCFWNVTATDPGPARPIAGPATACALLLAASLALGVFAAPADRFGRAAGRELVAPIAYLDAVLGSEPVVRAAAGPAGAAPRPTEARR